MWDSYPREFLRDLVFFLFNKLEGDDFLIIQPESNCERMSFEESVWFVRQFSALSWHFLANLSFFLTMYLCQEC